MKPHVARYKNGDKVSSRS